MTNMKWGTCDLTRADCPYSGESHEATDCATPYWWRQHAPKRRHWWQRQLPYRLRKMQHTNITTERRGNGA